MTTGPGLPAAGPEGVAVAVDGQDLGVGRGEPRRRGRGRRREVDRDAVGVEQVHGLVEPLEGGTRPCWARARTRRKRRASEADAGLAHQAHVVVPDRTRPLLRVVVPSEGDPVIGPRAHGRKSVEQTERMSTVMRQNEHARPAAVQPSSMRHGGSNRLAPHARSRPNRDRGASCRALTVPCARRRSVLSVLVSDRMCQKRGCQRRPPWHARLPARSTSRASSPSVGGVNRRTVLRGSLGAAALLGVPTLLCACGDDPSAVFRGPGARAGTVTLGSTSQGSGAAEGAAIASHGRRLPEGRLGPDGGRPTPSTTTPSRRTSTTACRAPPTTSSCGSPGTGWRFFGEQGPGRRHLRRLGHPDRPERGPQEVLDGRTTASSTSCPPPTTRGRCSTASERRGEGLHPAEDPRRADRPRAPR